MYYFFPRPLPRGYTEHRRKAQMSVKNIVKSLDQKVCVFLTCLLNMVNPDSQVIAIKIYTFGESTKV